MERIVNIVKLWTRDAHHRPWGFWLAVMWIVALGITVLGFLYLINFSEVALTSPAYVAILRIPGGLQTYGAIQLVLGLAFIAGLWHPTGWTKVKLTYVLVMIVITGVYAAVTALAFFAAPAIAGGERNVGWVLWGIIAAILMVGLPFTPTHHGLPAAIARSPGAGDDA